MNQKKMSKEELLAKSKKPSEEALKLHPFYKGKIQITSKCVIRDFSDFGIWYSPGVAASCLAIKKNKELSFEHTNRANTICIISDCTRVLGLGDIGPEAGMPVMEGKSLLFKYLGGVDAIPLCIDTKNAEDFILFKTRFLSSEKKDDPIHKAEIVRNIIKSIIQIPNFLKRSSYIKELAYELTIDEAVLYRELDNQLINSRKTTLAQKSIKKTVSEQDRPSALDRYLKNISSDQEEIVVKLLLLKGNEDYKDNLKYADIIIDEVSDTEWENPVFASVFNSYIEYRQEKKVYPDLKFFINHSNPNFQEVAFNCIELEIPLSENWKKRLGEHIETQYNYSKDIQKALLHYELRKLQLLKRKNSSNLRKEDLKITEEQTYQKMQMELEKKIKEISVMLGVVIY